MSAVLPSARQLCWAYVLTLALPSVGAVAQEAAAGRQASYSGEQALAGKDGTLLWDRLA